MRHLLVMLLLFCSCPLAAQVTTAEYFVDVDPGYGAATPLSLTPGNDLVKDFTLTLSSVTPGFHAAGVRARDAQGRWSLTYLHTFYVVPGVAAAVAASEYFIDTDPGYGAATAISAPVGTDSSLNYVVPLSAYAGGFHTIGIRSKDASGKWSQTSLHVFYNDVTTAPVNIVRLEYYFTGTGSNQQVYTHSVPAPAPNVDLNFTANLDGLVGEREYDMHIWAVNSEGARSEVLVKKIKVCTGEPAKARFESAQAGNRVSFINNSAGGTQYSWNFGDGQTDTVLNPLHSYTTVGNYNVRLIAASLCNIDTITKVVIVAGLKEITTNHGGNTGSVTVSITGAGFVPGTQLYLHRNGQTDISGDTLIIHNVGLMATTFNLAGKPVGVQDVIVIFPNGIKDTLHNGFTIETATNPKLWVNITGDRVLRIGFKQIYTISYGNSGNTDVSMVPLYVDGLPNGTNIETLNPVFDFGPIAAAENEDLSSYNLEHTFYDPQSGLSSRTFLLDNVPAGSSGTLNVIFNLPDSAPLSSTSQINVSLGKPQGVSPNYDVIRSDIQDCLDKFFELALDKGLEANLGKNEYDRSGLITCTKAASTKLYKLIKGERNRLQAAGFTPSNIYNGADEEVAKFITALGCTRALLTTVGVASLATKKPDIFKKLWGVNRALLRVQNKLENAKKYTEFGSLLTECGELFKYEASDLLLAIIGNAHDPNQKYGSGDASGNHYTTSKPLSYTINFENDPVANLNAQTVTVTDTLALNNYDKSSFGFTSVTIGDSMYSLPSPAKSFVYDFDFTSLYGVKARVTGTFDTTTGIAQWKFLSVDPVTNQATTNALAGFLPPDVNSPKGQGYVSFTISPQSNVQNEDSIKNKAFIKFDYNPVIATNTWRNVFDLVRPVSQVQALPSEVYDTAFTVQWRGTDNASGIRSYDVYYKVNNGTFQQWQYDVSLTEDSFMGQKDSTYSFFSIAKDYAGNIEGAKTNVERVVTVKLFDSSDAVCPTNNVTFSATAAGMDFTYQWQVNTGTGFVDIASNALYTGVNTVQLTLTTPPTAYAGYKFRCKISNGTVTYYSSLHSVKFVTTWLGTAGSAWETPSNWSCGLVPDENTDVIIPKTVPATPILNANAACKTLTMNNETNLLIKAGVRLTITGKL